MLLGMLLNMILGPFDFRLIAFPVNVVLGLIMIGIYLSLLFDKGLRRILNWLSGVKASIYILFALLSLTLVMGLIPQENSFSGGDDIFCDPFLFSVMTRSWIFVLVYLLTLFILGVVIVKRLIRFRVKDTGFYLNHVGLWVLLFSSGAGYGDVIKEVMKVEEGDVEWRVFDSYGKFRELPIAIQLNDFDIEYYSQSSPFPEPKRYISDVEIYTKDGLIKKGILEVNRPIRLGNWTVYQYGYDTRAGKYSSYSLFYLVYDPWIIVVYIGFIMVAMGAGIMIFTGRSEIQPKKRIANRQKSFYKRLPDIFMLAWILILALFIVGFWVTLKRPPLRTMGETRLWYSFFISIIGYLSYLKWRYKWLLSFSTIIAIIFIVINLVKPEIHSKNLMPALQSIWFIPHVISYIFSYAMFGAATIAAVIALKRRYSNNVKSDGQGSIFEFIDNIVYAGFGFLVLGMLMGAVWAKEAWGHYWSWDPKETWAFITTLTYLLFIHLRLEGERVKSMALWILIIGFVLLMITWFGVNYLPSAKGSIHIY